MQFIVVLFLCLVACKAAPNRGIVEIETNKVDEENLKQSQKEVEYTTITTFKRIEEIYMECVNETGLDKRVIPDLVKNISLLPKDDEKYQNFTACSYRKQHFLNDKGEIQYQNIKRFLSGYYKVEDLNDLDICGQLKQTSSAGRNAVNALECILPKLLKIQKVRYE